MAHDPCAGEWFGNSGEEGRAVCSDEPGRCLLSFIEVRADGEGGCLGGVSYDASL